MDNHNYLKYNKEAWNQKTKVHVDSEFYQMDRFKKGWNALNEIELNLLGDLKGKKVLHLQCHFGQDTLSLARLGAEVTGVDLSDEAINTARSISEELSIPATFICSDIFDLPNQLNQQFDIVFTSYGTIGWLPDLNRWASIVEQFLAPGGQFVMADFHPFIWTFDDDMQSIAYDYFKSDAIVEKIKGSYTDKDAPIETTVVSWNHGLSEIVQSLLSKGLTLKEMQEFDYSPYPCFSNLRKDGEAMYRFAHINHRIPMVYAFKFEK